MKSIKPVIIIILTVLSLLWISISLYVTTPSINLKNLGFVFWLALTVAGIYLGFKIFATNNKVIIKNNRNDFQPFDIDMNALSKGFFKPIIFIAGILIVYFVFAGVSSAVILRAGDYSKQLKYQTKTLEEFGNKVTPESIGTSTLPIIDEDIAKKLAEAKLSTYGSQYTLSDSFTLVHTKVGGKEHLVRVTPLEYNDFFVSFSRYSTGSVGYVKVDVVTGEAEFVKVDGGMPFIESALLNNNLQRHVWMKYPTYLTTDFSFEIDDNGVPYWVVTYYDNKVGISGGQDPQGVIVVNATTGAMTAYPTAKVPEWVDRVVPVDLVYLQANNALTYKNGWFNANLGSKKDIFNLTAEYNYISLNHKTYLYAGITSPNSADQTSVGFMLIDLKTKEATKYVIKGITEARAMDIAKSQQQVKAQNLTPTVPLLININDEPTYFLILKNDFQRQWFVLMNVADGTVISMNSDLKACKSDYISKITNSNPNDTTQLAAKTGKVLRFYQNASTNMVDFILVGDVSKTYSVPLSLGNGVKFLQQGDEVSFKYIESGDGTGLVRAFVNKSLK